MEAQDPEIPGKLPLVIFSDVFHDIRVVFHLGTSRPILNVKFCRRASTQAGHSFVKQVLQKKRDKGTRSILPDVGRCLHLTILLL